MTNTEFNALTSEERLAFFAQVKEAGQEAVDALTKGQAKEYNEWLAGDKDIQDTKEDDEARAAEAVQTRAKEFFKDNKDYELGFIYVTSDLNVFFGNIKGDNLATNHASITAGVKIFKVFK